MSDDNKRRRVSNYVNGGSNALVARPRNPGEDLLTSGQWTDEQLQRMDADFVTAMERALKRGHERRASAKRLRASWRGRSRSAGWSPFMTAELAGHAERVGQL
jgi:hypothetical protein